MDFGPIDFAMRHSIAFIGLSLLLVGSGCTSTLTRDGLARRVARYDLTSWPDFTYYCGSKSGYDYFFIKESGPGTVPRHRFYRVPESEGGVSNRFAYATDRRHWRVHHGW